MSGILKFKPKWIQKWGIESMSIPDDYEIVSGVGWFYIHKYGDTAPSCCLRRLWFNHVSYTDKDGKYIQHLPKEDNDDDV